ncbi:MAG: FtsX-like permease family protein [Clostridium sp.]|nr:FtsX-like permease family protein [Clostridium sp.]
MKILSKITWENLKKNKTRTLVTIIGIMLSVSLFTAVISSISSAKSYMINIIIEDAGNYHGKVYQVNSKDIQPIFTDSEIASVKKLQNIGYAEIEGIQNEYKPYLFVGAMDDQFVKDMPVKIKEGSLPKNNKEIIIPEHVRNDGGVTYRVGEVITLNLGERRYEGEVLNQHNSFISKEESAGEAFLTNEKRAYTVVGIYERPDFEDYSAPGYTALTISDGAGPDNFDIFIELKDMSKIYSFIDLNFPDKGAGYNSDLLRFSGNSDDQEYNAVLYSLAAVLSLLIMFGSVSLIYNSFSISISERSKQFGLLKSMGATRKQVLKSVIIEGLMLSVIGIPLGLLLGLVGIGTTFRLSSTLFSNLVDGGTKTRIGLEIDPIALTLAAALGLITVLISAYIPAKKAAKLSVIDSLRQTDDIKIKPGKVKTNRLVYKMFGFEGMLASKNFKRNRRKYRATVISLFMSVVLFISASSFSSYLQKSISSVSSETPYDIQYTLIPDDDLKVDEIKDILLQAKGIEDYSISYITNRQVLFLKDDINTEYKKSLDSDESMQYFYYDKEYYRLYADFIFVDQLYYEKILKENNIVLDEKNGPQGIYYNQRKQYDPESGRYLTGEYLKEGRSISGTQLRLNEFENEYFTGLMKGDEYIYTEYRNDTDVFYLASEIENKESFVMASSLNQIPMVSSIGDKNQLKIIYPMDELEEVSGDYGAFYGYQFVFKTDESMGTFDEMVTLLENKGLPTNRLYDYREGLKIERSMIAIVNIFSFGFIILISLIAGANVFNTISTNIQLRRREFAMLKSVGMTKKGFNKMMVFESLLYGVKGILYGIPVALGVTYLIYRSVLQGADIQFYVPVNSIIIAILSVFIVVFATSIFAMDKIKKDNPIDALKNENL